MKGTSIGNRSHEMGLCEGAVPQKVALLVLFESACVFRASLGGAVVTSLSGLFLGAILR